MSFLDLELNNINYKLSVLTAQSGQVAVANTQAAPIQYPAFVPTFGQIEPVSINVNGLNYQPSTDTLTSKIFSSISSTCGNITGSLSYSLNAATGMSVPLSGTSVSITLTNPNANNFVVGQIVFVQGNSNGYFNNVSYTITAISSSYILQTNNPTSIPSLEVGGGGTITGGIITTRDLTAVNVNGTTITASGAVNAGSVVSTGAISGTTITGTGAISGTTITGTGEIKGASYTGTAATKMILNSTEATNGTIELQKSGVKTGDILYANASYPLQLKSTAGISFDTLANGNINIAPDGSGFNQLISTSTGGTNAVLSGVVCAQIKADATGGSPILLIQGLTTNTNHTGIQVINNCNDFQNSIRLTAGPGYTNPLTTLYHMEFSNNGTSQHNISQNASTGVMTYGGASDRRLKKNIDYDFDALNMIGQLKPATFSMKQDTQDTLLFGFIAQDVLPIFPQYIITGQDGMYQMDYSHFTGLLCKAIQEQNELIVNQQKQIDELKLLVNSMINKVL